MQAFAVIRDKNIFSYACNLGLKVSRADSGRNGKSIKFPLLFPHGLWTIKTHLMNTPSISSTTCIDIEKYLQVGR